MVAQLTTDRPPDLSAPRATGSRRAEQGTPLADILHAYRIGFTEFWEAIVEESRRSRRAPPDLLVDAASGVWWLIGEYTQELTVAYREAAAELLLAFEREATTARGQQIESTEQSEAVAAAEPEPIDERR
jgi:hypothetical protein